MHKIFDLPCVEKHVDHQSLLRSIPATNKQFNLALWHFNYSEQSKFGERGRFPTNLQYKAHFGSFLQNGYEPTREAVDVRFKENPLRGVGDDDSIHPFSVLFIDGQNKLLIMQSTLALLECIDITPEELEEDEHICRVIASFKYIRCNFKKLARPEDYVYESLGLANRTAEKTKPSCLDYVLFFSEAVRLKKESEPHKSLRDCLWAAIQEYNKKNPKKLAQRDTASLAELLNIATLFTWLKPKMDLQLGADSTVLKSIMEMVLDPELKAHIKGADANFDLSKLAFFQEAKGVEQYDSLGASTISGKVLPWMQKTFQGMGCGLRRFDKERLFAFINCVAAGILTAPKILYTVETVTQLAHNCPRTFVAVVLLPNRA
ncbi:Uncharacterized protein SCF082_LOCUS7739, partial [Durusdinium trenchii]